MWSLPSGRSSGTPPAAGIRWSAGVGPTVTGRSCVAAVRASHEPYTLACCLGARLPGGGTVRRDVLGLGGARGVVVLEDGCREPGVHSRPLGLGPHGRPGTRT